MKISQIIKTVIAGTLISTSTITFSLYHSEKAKAEVDHYYRDGFQYPTYVTALNKAKKISNKKLSISHYTTTKQSKLKAIGRVSNKNGWKKGSNDPKVRKQDSMGTGTVIGSHTFITNAHVIDDRYGKAAAAKYISFDMNRDGKSIPYHFHASKVIKVPQSDIAVVHTKENMGKYVKPIRIATDKEIKSLKFNSTLYSLGYPWQHNDNTKAYFNRLRFVQFSGNGSEILTKDIFRSGASGSPMLDSKFSKIYGLRTYGYNLDGKSTDQYAKQEMACGESFKGSAGQFVRNNIK